MKIKLNSTFWMTLECSVVIFQALEYLWPQWPQQPQQPQWPQWPQQPHFTKEITEFYVSINHGTKMTYPGLSMWNGSSKTHCFIDFWHPFSWRLWRTGMLLLTKLKGHRSNFHYSGFPNHPQTKSSLNISICQSQIKKRNQSINGDPVYKNDTIVQFSSGFIQIVMSRCQWINHDVKNLPHFIYI